MPWSYDSNNLNTNTASGRLSKKCTNCNLEKKLTDYYKNSYSKDGFYSTCKTCRKEKDREYRILNKDKIKVKQKRYYSQNKEVFYSYNATRRAISRKAKPSWLTPEQSLSIDSLYYLAKDCQIISGETYHVDHIVPLRGSNVCGLHVPWNLQVIPSDLNAKKYNNFEGGW